MNFGVEAKWFWLIKCEVNFNRASLRNWFDSIDFSVTREFSLHATKVPYLSFPPKFFTGYFQRIYKIILSLLLSCFGKSFTYKWRVRQYISKSAVFINFKNSQNEATFEKKFQTKKVELIVLNRVISKITRTKRNKRKKPTSKRTITLAMQETKISKTTFVIEVASSTPLQQALIESSGSGTARGVIQDPPPPFPRLRTNPSKPQRLISLDMRRRIDHPPFVLGKLWRASCQKCLRGE